MDLQYTLEAYALQLKNVPRTLVAVASVVQKIMKTLYDAHFQMPRTQTWSEPGVSRQRHSRHRGVGGVLEK